MTIESVERLEFLLAMRATDALDVGEEREVAHLLEQHPSVEEDGYELAAAALLTDAIVEEPLPRALRAKLIAEGEALVAARKPSNIAVFPPAAPARPALLGWLAAAACLLLAVTAWWPRLIDPAGDSRVAAEASPPIEAPPTAEERRTRLMQVADVQSLAWTATEDPAAAGASGDVVWSPSRQEGFMRIRRLEANEPTAQQYQLWIFDRERDERYPVDGGVFDMPAGVTEAIVPIDARIPVADPYLFAVTVEEPGGVVVSDRERIVLVAQAAA